MPSPLAHQLGFCYGMLLALGLGVPLVLTDVWRAARAAQLIQENGATFCFAATPFLSDLVERGKRLGRLRLFATARHDHSAGDRRGGALEARHRGGRELGHDRECGLSITAHGRPDGEVLETSDGRALPGGEVRIVDDDGARAAAPAAIGSAAGARLVASSSAISSGRSSTDSTPTAGSTPATSRAWTTTATSASSAAARTSSSAAARTSRWSRSRAAIYRHPAGGRRGRRGHARRAARGARLRLRHARSRGIRSTSPWLARQLAARRHGQALSGPSGSRCSPRCRAPPTGKIQKFVLRSLAKELRPQVEDTARAA